MKAIPILINFYGVKMSDFAIVVPSRNRPNNIERLRQAWIDTGATADLLVYVDEDDPVLDQYKEPLIVIPGERKFFGPKTDGPMVEAAHNYNFVGFMGDDHLPLTYGWDEIIKSKLKELKTGVVYGNDLHQGERLCTAVFLTSDILVALGHFCPPGFVHMFLDSVWMGWGRGIDRLCYLPDVIIEHFHPNAGKAENDYSYEQSNGMMEQDGKRYAEYVQNEYAIDIEKIKAVMK